ncbi:DUF433 domain-containing protein [Streptosporangium sp. NPDC006013]|uniref:DUF433 domain-containing protein n=1 Tax=Streptosporangium sp. NPDC006013 TaxID=3155596 RepID=UPI0033B4D090
MGRRSCRLLSDIAPVGSQVKRLNLAEGVWTDAKGDSRDLAVLDVDVPAVLLKSHLRLVSEPATDSIDVLWDFSRTEAGAGLIEARTGRHVIREIVTGYLDYVVRAEDGFPADLRLRSCLPSNVVVDPHRAFGQPIFAETRTRVSEVAAMMKAGEEPEVIADELGVTLDDVRTATRILLGHAA